MVSRRMDLTVDVGLVGEVRVPAMGVEDIPTVDTGMSKLVGLQGSRGAIMKFAVRRS